MDKLSENQQKMRERATYRYLEALDSGDINTIAELLQQAVYDAPLEQMLLEAHQAYFQEEQSAQHSEFIEEEITTPLLVPVANYQRKTPQHSPAWWMRALVAVLIVGVLVGSFLTILTLRQSWLSNLGGTTSTPTACHSYPLKQYGVADGSNMGSQDAYLNAVDSLSVNDAWAVGTSLSGSPAAASRTKSPFIEHWNGKSWQPVSSPAIVDGNGGLNAVAAISTHDVWVVGSSSSNTAASSSIGGERPLIEHWDGESWHIVAAPYGPTGNGLLNSLTAISPNDIWVAGSSEDNVGVPQPLLEHWDGRNWQIVAADKGTRMRSGLFNDIAAVASNDIWAVGESSNFGHIGPIGLVEHWNGQKWQLVTAPADLEVADKVSIVSSKSIWIEGSALKGSVSEATLTHWDGQRWTKVALPSALIGGTVLVSNMAVVADNSVWIIANTRITTGVTELYLAHWDGRSWKPVKVPLLVLPVNAPNIIATGMVMHSGSQLWIVGYSNGNEGDPTSLLILGQLSCSP